jgi:hypothetical protein
MEAAQQSPAIAALFHAGELRVAAEFLGGVHAFNVPDSESGLSEFEQQLASLQFREMPFLCICATPSSTLQGFFFEQLCAAPFPKFLMAQPMYEILAKDLEQPVDSAATLLRVFRSQFPRQSNAA